MRYRPGVVQGFLASAGLGLVCFSVTSGLDEVQDGLRPQAEIKGGEANPVPRSTAARWRSISSAVASPLASRASWSWSKLARSSAPTAGSDTGM